MNYENWMISLYDFYREEYKRYYQIEKERFFKRVKRSYNKGKVRGVIKEFFSFRSKKAMIGFVIYCVLEIVASIFYLIGLKDSNLTMVVIGLTGILIPPLFLIKTMKFSIDSYEKCVIVIKKILIQKGINSDEKLKQLTEDSGKFIRKSAKLDYILKLLQISIPVITPVIKKINIESINSFIKYNIELISIITILAIVTITIYILILNRPNGKRQKFKELNNLLKITLIYK